MIPTPVDIKRHNALLNYLVEQLGVTTDSALARKLDVAPPVISKIRHGHMAIGATLQLGMLDSGALTHEQLRRYVSSSVTQDIP
jgi:hypothetical protein